MRGSDRLVCFPVLPLLWWRQGGDFDFVTKSELGLRETT